MSRRCRPSGMLCQSSPYSRIARCVFRNSIGTSSLNNELCERRFPKLYALWLSQTKMLNFSLRGSRGCLQCKTPVRLLSLQPGSQGVLHCALAPCPGGPLRILCDIMEIFGDFRRTDEKGIRNPWVAQGSGSPDVSARTRRGVAIHDSNTLCEKMGEKGSVTANVNDDISLMISEIIAGMYPAGWECFQKSRPRNATPYIEDIRETLYYYRPAHSRCSSMHCKFVFSMPAGQAATD